SSGEGWESSSIIQPSLESSTGTFTSMHFPGKGQYLMRLPSAPQYSSTAFLSKKTGLAVASPKIFVESLKSCDQARGPPL
ncbi:hypothetical protein, partial [Pseudoduganella sp. RAF53_2]|uniref:hypothetical protein n=1 Tax=Pseudoduganella sp. RAF53_2 TaxID=3233060 RepID=UPI003F9A1827